MEAPIHILHEGHALCGLRGPPSAWVDGAKWVRRDEDGATCQVCIDCKEHGIPSWHSMNLRVMALNKKFIEVGGQRRALEVARDAAVAYAAVVNASLHEGNVNVYQVGMATAELLVLLGNTRAIVPETDSLVLDVVARLEAAVRVMTAEREQQSAR